MKHPTPDEWMSFLYGEDEPGRHAELHAHLAGCAECAARVQDWRASMKSLDDWPAPSQPRSVRRYAPVLRWAAAAAVVLVLGFALGRGAGRDAGDIETLKASMGRELDQKLAAALQTSQTDLRALLTEFAQAQAGKQTADQQAIINALRQLDAKYAANLTALRRELETVALNTEDGFLQARQQLGLLASYTQPQQNQPK